MTVTGTEPDVESVPPEEDGMPIDDVNDRFSEYRRPDRLGGGRMSTNIRFHQRRRRQRQDLPPDRGTGGRPDRRPRPAGGHPRHHLHPQGGPGTQGAGEPAPDKRRAHPHGDQAMGQSLLGTVNSVLAAYFFD